MKVSEMKKKWIALTATVGVVMLAAGFLLGYLLKPARDVATDSIVGRQMQNADEGSRASDVALAGNILRADVLQFRIDDGEVQWFDGTRWNTVAPVEKLAGEDKFQLAQAALKEFEEQYLQNLAGENIEENGAVEGGISFARDDHQLLTGQKEQSKKTPTATPKPVTQSEKPQAVVTNTENTNADNGNHDGGGDDSQDSGGGDTLPSEPAPQPTPAPEPNPTPAPAPDLGDGEDMEFGDWFE